MRRATLTLGAVLTLASCGGGDSGSNNPSGPPTPAAVSTVEVTPTTSTLLPPATVQLSAVTKDAAGNTLSGRVVTWSSASTAVASVSAAGLVTSVAAGKVDITATSEGRTGTASITVLAPVASVTLDKTVAALAPTDTVRLTATPRDAAGAALADRAVTWTSSAPAIATVTPAGLVTAVATGSATISATTEGKSASASISVVVPVASVTLDKTTAKLLPGEGVQLTAATKDAGGASLTGRSVTWSSSAATVAAVSATGLVSAVSAGSATITASSEGKSASAAITVDDGGLVTAAGGTVNAAGGAVKVVIPAGAINGPTSVTVSSAPTLPTMPLLTYAVAGTGYNIGASGATLSTPATVSIAYDAGKLPAWATPSDLALYHYNGSAWELLPNLTIDSTAKTISARTTSFSPFTVGLRLPPATLTPSPASINFYQRSVTLTASLPNHSGTGLQYSWSTTGNNGTVNGVSGNQAQYTMTGSTLPPGDVDDVQVIIRGNINPATPNVLVPLASAIGKVNARLQYSFELTPQFNKPNFGQAITVDAVVKNPDGTPYTGKPANGRVPALPVMMIWKATQNHGSFPMNNPGHKTNTSQGVYTAKSRAASAPQPARVDQIDVEFYVGYARTFTHDSVQAGIVVTDSVVARFDSLSGTASAFMDVEPKTYVAIFKVRSIPSPGGQCITADAIVPRVAGATSYDLTVTGIVTSYNAPTYHKTFTGPTSTGSILDIYLDPTATFYGVPMEGGCATTPQGIQGRINNYQTFYQNATFTVKTSP